jgi:predicted DNA-binding protein
MTSIRLPKELEEKLNSLAERENITKSEIIKEALRTHPI